MDKRKERLRHCQIARELTKNCSITFSMSTAISSTPLWVTDETTLPSEDLKSFIRYRPIFQLVSFRRSTF